MSNQEMQFADPDWKPSQKLNAKTGAQEQETYNPQPINAYPREQSQEKTAPPQQDVYAGLPPYAGTALRQPAGGQYGQRQYRRRARSPWFWIILAFIIISLMGGGFGSAFNRSFDPDYPRMGQFHPNAVIVEPAQNFKVSSISPPTVVITGDSGIINVNTSPDATSVFVQDTKNPGTFGNANNIQVTSSQNGNTITTNVQGNGQGSVDFQVTVPQGADLQLTTTSGDISIHGVTLSGKSTITTDSGNINFNGAIATSGTAQFTTSSGLIDLTVPADSAFHLTASTNSGSMNTADFPSLVRTNNQGGSQATGNVGAVSQGQGATVTLHTDSGDINLHQGS